MRVGPALAIFSAVRGGTWTASWMELFLLAGSLLGIAIPAALVGLYPIAFLGIALVLGVTAVRSTANACVLVALFSPIMAIGSVDIGFNFLPSYPIIVAGLTGLLWRREFRRVRLGMPDAFLAVFATVAVVVSLATFDTAPATTVVDSTGVNARPLRSAAQLSALLLMTGVYALFRVGAGEAAVRMAVLRALVVAFTCVALYGAYQFIARLFGLPFGYLNERRSLEVLPTDDGYVRINSTLTEASPLAQFSILALLIGVAALISRGPTETLMPRRAAHVVVFAALGVIFASLSKAALVGLVVGIAVALGLSTRTARMRRVRYGAALLVVFIGGAVVARSPDVLTNPGEIVASERYVRIGYWQAALDIAAAHPLGVGVGNFTFHYPHFAPISNSYEYFPGVTDAHNWYLEAFAETGLLGGAAFLCFVVSLLGTVLLAGRRRHHDGPLILCLGGALLAGAVMHLTYSVFYYPFEWVLAGLASGWAASWAPDRVTRSAAANGHGRQRRSDVVNTLFE